MTTKMYKRGEKGHCEYNWSSNIEEKINQLEFQLHSGMNDEDNKYIEKNYRSILDEIGRKIYNHESKELLVKMYKLIVKTRDIHKGKGLRTISYMMIKNWYEFFYHGSEEILSTFVHTNNLQKPYGSWKDMKYFCDYCVKNGWDENHELILYVVEMMNDQVKKDWEVLQIQNMPSISLVSKWIPREKSKMAWLHKKLVENYFPEYFSSITIGNKERAWKKAAMEYRKIVAGLNRALDTVQIKQCANQWSEINFSTVTKKTLLLQKNSFLNVEKNGDPRYFTEDRILCSESVKKYIDTEDEKKSSENIGVGKLVKEAIDLIQNKDNLKSELYDYKKKTINRLWGVTKKVERDKMRIAMVDVSSSMKEESLHTAIGLACKIAEHSLLGKRILTFSGYPIWISLDDCETFVDCIEKIDREKSILDINTNFYGALNLITEAIRDSHLNSDEIKNMSLIVFSDMQMDVEFPFYKPLYETIEEKCECFGVVPEICFWNVETSDGFPCLFDNKSRVKTLSGDNFNEFKKMENYESVRFLIESCL